jgi:hypothetical protein
MLELRSAGTRPIGHDFYEDNCNKPILGAATALTFDHTNGCQAILVGKGLSKIGDQIIRMFEPNG